MSRTFIGLHGFPGAGKDTVAKYLALNHGFQRFAFGDILKRELLNAFKRLKERTLYTTRMKGKPSQELTLKHCNDDRFVKWLQAHTPIGLDDMLTPRYVMQQWGDWRKATRGENYFVERLYAKLQPYRCDIVVTDVRYNYEAEMLRKSFDAVIWKVVRPNNPHYKPDGHSSNVEIDGTFIDKVIPNLSNVFALQQGVEVAMAQAL